MYPVPGTRWPLARMRARSTVNTSLNAAKVMAFLSGSSWNGVAVSPQRTAPGFTDWASLTHVSAGMW